jgi:DNA modification methylase
MSTAIVDYQAFIASKARYAKPVGFEAGPLNPLMKPFQKSIVRWALRGGRRAIFADTGLGKTFMQLEWAHNIPGRVLVLAPLAVAEQTAREAEKFGIHGVAVVSDPSDDRIQITNYEKIHRFTPERYSGIVLDESSILKGFTSKFRAALTAFSDPIPYRLPCSATPAPNDYMELGNHAEYLGVMKCSEMLAMFFTHDGGDTSKWRLKGHAQSEFWKWVASWAVAVRRPSDIGFDDTGYDLPALNMYQHAIESGIVPEGKLFMVEAETLQERHSARRDTIALRVAKAAELANGDDGPWIMWCGLNDESKAITAAIPGAVEVTGSDSPEHKRNSMLAFQRGEIRVIVSKPEIMGFGMNYQHCRNMAFVGMSDSFEQFYQAVRRCWRFGQTKEVNAHVITTDIEGAVVRNIERKERQANEMMAGMVDHMKSEMEKNLGVESNQKSEYKRDVFTGERFTAHLGDCVEVVGELPSDSIHYSIFSPPFASLYTYSNSDRDMGNCASYDQFMEQFTYLVHQLHRVIMPGRLVSFHCMNLPMSKEMHGFIGVRDFRGILIKLFQDAGFIFHSEVCIWKDPVTAMQRTKAIGLLYKQLRKDSTISRQGIPDYLVTMRKHGENQERVTKTHESFPVSLWQRYASPVWMDIDQSNTLARAEARDEDDERHICPLQLDVIERGIRLWSNEGDTVLSPFMGIGSEGYQALKMQRKFIGAELKASYWQVAVKNLKQAEHDKMRQGGLFDAAD